MLLLLSAVLSAAAAAPARRPAVSLAQARKPVLVPQIWTGGGRVLEADRNGRTLWARSGDSLAAWDLRTGFLRETTRLPGRTYPLPAGDPNPSRRKRVVVDDGILRVLGPDGSALRQINVGHRDELLGCLALSPDGKLAAVGWPRGVLQLWELDSGAGGEIARDLPDLQQAAFSADSRLLATGTRSSVVTLWDVPSRRLRHRLTGPPGIVPALAFSADSQLLAVGAANFFEPAQTLVFDTATGGTVATLNGHRSLITALAFSPDGRSLASAGEDGMVRLWDPREGKELASYEGGRNGVNGLVFSRDGSVLYSSSKREVRAWSVAFRQELPALRDRLTPRMALAYSPDGRLLAVTGDLGRVHLWNVRTGRLERVLKGFSGVVMRAQFSPDGKLLATGGMDFLVRIWNTDTGSLLRTLKGHRGWITSLAFSKDGKRLASSGAENETAGVIFGRPYGTPPLVPAVRLWDSRTGALIREFPVGRDMVTSLSFNPKGDHLAGGGSSGPARLWDCDTGEILVKSEQNAPHVAFTPDGQWLLLGQLVCDPATLEVRTPLPIPGVTRLRFSADGRWFAAVGAGQSEVVVGPSPKGDPGDELRTLMRERYLLQDVALSPDGKVVAVADYGGVTTLLAARDGRELASLVAVEESGVAFTPDGYYTGGSAALECLARRDGDRLLPISAADRQYDRADVLVRRLAGVFSDPPPVDQLPRPRLTVAEEPPRAARAETLSLAVSATDPMHRLVSVSVKVNGVAGPGVLLRGASTKLHHWQGAVPIALSPGRNRVELRVLNDRGVASVPEVFDVFRVSESSLH